MTKNLTAVGHPFASVPVMNPLQLGGIETSTLDNGPGRGVRIAWVNTGGGLRYKVVIDRGMDIADAEFLGQSLTWHSLTGITAPSLAYTRGMDWLRGFYGGLVVSCGPLHTGAPFVENNVDHGLHGTHSYTPASVEFINNPDPLQGKFEMNITGIVRTARVFNPNLELRRTISSTLGEPAIRIYDRFTNRGNEPIEHCWLLHINFGFPLLEPEVSTYCYKGVMTPRADSIAWFKRQDFRVAPEPQESHRGTGEVFSYIDAATNDDGEVVAGVVNRKRGFGVEVRFLKEHYPRLGNWQHWGPNGSYTGALEPMTAGVEGKPIDRQRGWVRTLQPGESIELRCALTVTQDAGALQRLIQLNG